MTSSKRKPLLHLWLLEFAADLFAVVAAYFTIFYIRFHSQWGLKFFTWANSTLGVRDTAELDYGYESFYLASSFRIILLITATVCTLYSLLDLYSTRRPLRKPFTAWNVILANAIALTIFYVYFYFSRNVFHPRSLFVTIMPVNAAFCIVLRHILSICLAHLRNKHGLDVVHAVMAGSGEDAEKISGMISLRHPHGITITQTMPFDLQAPFGEMLDKIDQLITSSSADLLIMAERRLTAGQIMQILEKCAEHKIPAKILSEKLFVVVNQARIRSDLIHGIPLLHFGAPSSSNVRDVLERVADVTMSLLALIVIFPILLLIAVLIRTTSRGPVLFRQERIGVNRKPFTMFKFRTMHNRADELVAQLEEFNESGEGLFKIRKDPRTTGIGRVLRRFSFDELPQLVNVLKGDMSIIGPRPLPRRDFEGYYENWHYSRHEGLPGITCLWQVSGRSDLDFHNMCILDVYYLRNRSWVLNLRILFRTVHAVLFARGAY